VSPPTDLDIGVEVAALRHVQEVVADALQRLDQRVEAYVLVEERRRVAVLHWKTIPDITTLYTL